MGSCVPKRDIPRAVIGAIAIGAMELFSFAAHYPLAVIPFATSIVLVIGSPDVEPAQPRATPRPAGRRMSTRHAMSPPTASGGMPSAAVLR